MTRSGRQILRWIGKLLEVAVATHKTVLPLIISWPSSSISSLGSRSKTFPDTFRNDAVSRKNEVLGLGEEKKGRKRRAGPGAAAATATAGSPSMTNEPCGLPSRKSSSFSTGVWCWDLMSSFSQSTGYMGTNSRVCSVSPQCPRRLQKTRESWTNALISPQSSWSHLMRLS